MKITAADYSVTDNGQAIKRLTALWALTESGLGGIMFALKIPLTGFILGAIAVILLSLIADLSKNNYKKILQATVLVLMVKAAVSPHSSPPAYFAVAFQGLCAAFIFRFIPSHKIACISLGIITMLESALQKVILLTVLFGKNIWDALNGLLTEIFKNLSTNAHQNYAEWLIIAYLIFYSLWGALTGVFAASLPERMNNQKNKILTFFIHHHQEAETITEAKKPRKKGKKILIYTAILVFIIIVMTFTSSNGHIRWILLRSITALILIYFIVLPLVKSIFTRWLQNRSHIEKEKAIEIMNILPILRGYLHIAFALSARQNNFLKKWTSFVTAMIVLTLYEKEA